MKIGVIGLGECGTEIVARLLRRTCHDLYAYDPDGRCSRKTVRMCESAAEVCDVCGVIFLALDSESDQIALLNAAHTFFHPGSFVADWTPISPAQAHKNANTFRRAGIGYLDCAVFSPEGHLADPFLCFVGGNGEVFTHLCPLLRCVAPDCRHMGPAGRGQAVRMLCLSLTAELGQALDRTAELAGALGIRPAYFLDAISKLDQVARPLAALGGETCPFRQEELKQGVRIANEMKRRSLSLPQNAKKGIF